MVLILFFDPFSPKNRTLHSKNSTKIILAIQDGLSRFFSGNAGQECDIEELMDGFRYGSRAGLMGFSRSSFLSYSGNPILSRTDGCWDPGALNANGSYGGGGLRGGVRMSR